MARSDAIWRILTLHCDEASRLSSESLDHELSGADRIASQLHRMICRACRQHHRDILTLREVSRLTAEPIERPGLSMPASDRDQIKRNLKDSGLAG